MNGILINSKTKKKVARIKNLSYYTSMRNIEEERKYETN